MFREKLYDLLQEASRISYEVGHDRQGFTASHSQRARIESIYKQILDANDRPKVGVGVLVFNYTPTHGVRLLCEQRKNRLNHGDGEWSVPGGWMEHGESFEQAALRELAEETGLSATHARLVHTVVNTFPNNLHCVTGFVVVRNWFPLPGFDGPTIREPDKTAKLEWHQPECIPEPHFPPIVDLARNQFKLLTNDEVLNGRRKDPS